MGHNSGTLTHCGNLIGQVRLIVLSPGILLGTSSLLINLIGQINFVVSSSKFSLKSCNSLKKKKNI